jgi:DNA-binding MarR family transcriptional regulator
MEESKQDLRDLGLLEEIERDPDTTQATLASRLGVAVGTVNWHLKRLVAKGYVKVRRAERRKLRYIITPEGLALRARSMVLYRQARAEARRALKKARDRGYDAVRVEGKGDIAEICRLTCLEQGIPVVMDGNAGQVGVLEVVGSQVLLRQGEGGE